MKKILLVILSVVVIMPIAADNFQATMKKAIQGDVNAQYQLGLMFVKGEGVESNYSTALAWFRKAADQNHVIAQRHLGEMFMEGKGTKKDYNQAIAWFQEAANQGDVISLCDIAEIYMITKDYSQAIDWYKKAVNQGDVKSQCSIADIYMITKDYAQAVDWYKKAANNGEEYAQYQLGCMYEKGNGVERDFSQAACWFYKAAKQKNSKAFNWLLYSAENDYVVAQRYLGELYLNGKGIAKDYAKAITWFRKAATQGDAIGQYNLGLMCFNGYGISKDDFQAISWFRRSAEQGYAPAQNQLGYMYYFGHGETKDYSQAIIWFQRAAEQGDDNAQYNLGIMHDKGLGTNIDYSKAIVWYKKAATNGNSDAQKRYKELEVLGYKATNYDPQNPPLLVLVDNSVTFADATSNNCLDANEHGTIFFKIQNLGKGFASDCEARIRLSGTSNGIAVNSINLPEIAPGNEVEVSIPIKTNEQTLNGNVTFAIEIYEPSGFGVAPFNLSVATAAFVEPLMRVVDYQISSTSGQVKKMEPFTLTFNLQNTKYGNAEDVQVTIITPQNVFLMDGSNKLSYSLIESGEVQTIEATFVANNNADANIPIVLDVKEKYGRYAESREVNIVLNQNTTTNVTITANQQPQQQQSEIEIATLVSAVDRNIPQSKNNNKNTFAVIIANENYQSVASVPYALNDGKIFYEYCLKTLGVPEKQVKYVPNATANQIKAQVTWLQNICEVFEDAQIIFYYAGHGIPDESSRTAYLLPVDGLGTDVTTGYKLDDLYTILGNIPTKNVTVFMDACFSGSKRENGMLASARGVAIKARSGMPQGNMVVFSAAQGDETAYPNNEEKHGMFTYYLLEKLQESKGEVTLYELGEYITKMVSQQSILLNGKSQTPCVTASPSLGNSWESWKLK